MKQSVNKSDFCAAFNEMDRGDNFTPAALSALFEYLEEFEQDTGTEIDLDIIALCCDFTECENLVDWARSYHTNNQYGEYFSDLDGDELDEAISEYILDHGQLIEFDGGIIVSEF